MMPKKSCERKELLTTGAVTSTRIHSAFQTLAGGVAAPLVFLAFNCLNDNKRNLLVIVLTVSINFFLFSNPSYCAPTEIWKITYYDACVRCCGKSDAITASGKKAKAGETVALNWLPFGTKVRIGNKVYTVQDRGAESQFGTYYHRKHIKSRIKHIDVFVNSHQEARKLGVKYLPVEVLA